MKVSGPVALLFHLALPLLTLAPDHASADQIQVAYAGSMGVVLDRFLGPEFAKSHGLTYQGIGQGSYGLARLIQSKQIRPDVFISVTRGPIDLLLRSGLLTAAEPIASTEMVITYNPKSRFGVELQAAEQGKIPWYSVLETKGLRFGRTDPATDPQGRNIIFAFLLAQRYYSVPDLMKKILGEPENPAQIFTEASLLSRLEAGQLDASSGYRSAAVSHGLPYISLPPEINLGDAGFADSWYSRAAFTLKGADGSPETLHTQPLVFYAGVPVDARRADLGREFVSFLRSEPAQSILREKGYSPPTGSGLP
ncbi:MAG TPA: extracellular solute-binding protein [Spirochaetia bacterium]|nr:extracellular solute-binding protein [Spirochaetia bacterium]